LVAVLTVVPQPGLHPISLLVVDYADARVTEVQALMRVLAQRTNVPRAAVVLTARSTEGDWLEIILRTETATRHPLSIEPMGLADEHPNPLGILTATASGLGARSHEPAVAEDFELVPIPHSIDWTTLDLVLLGWIATQRGDTLPNTRSTLYRTVFVTPSRSAIAMTLASVPLSGRSAYCSTSSAIRS
jgi:hypothetical protein